MQEDNTKDKESKPASYTVGSRTPRAHRANLLTRQRWMIIGVILLCFVASFLGSYILLRTGLVKPDATQTITENRDKIVLQQGEVVADVAKNAGPSVVSITSDQAVQGSRFLGGSSVQTGAGSGIIMSKDGYVMTNKHVVPDGSSNIVITTSDGTEYKDVTVIGRDTVNDVAFLKIGGVSNLPAATIGDSSKVVVGQQVVAIGNALGEFQNTVTSGIISGMGRPLQASSGGDQTSAGSTESLENLFQTDAAINEGNSGGPLLNLNGEVIGIDTAIAQNAQGIGFAIPVNDIKALISSVLQKGKLERGLLGVRYVAIDGTVAAQYKLPVKQGAYLVGDCSNPAITAGGAADKAGLKAGDIITKVNNDTLTQGRSLASLLGQYAPGQSVTLTVLRDGKTQTFQVALEAAS
ncbi:MAG TPA: trypsin-like peptidase domain-containing protein [Candidatus Saccharimonadales bacterium]|nr:trypsin-like peptidase domain-containing protein [Candidatus Saccharimonadales bacterium]